MKKCLFTVIMFWLCIFGVQAKTYLVAIGLADYPGNKMDLKVSAYDALTIKNLYDKNGDAETVVMTNSDAKLSEVLKTMSSAFGKAKEEDAIVLFFSGHGVPGGFVCYDQILEYESINKIMIASAAHNKMVFSDACFSGKARKTDRHSYTHYDVNIMFFLSSRTDETSQEIRGWKNSLFTAYLERGLRGGADANMNRTISALELFEFVSKGVAKDSKDKQHPVMWGNFDNEMPVMVW